jgi:hypothetical protein
MREFKLTGRMLATELVAGDWIVSGGNFVRVVSVEAEEIITSAAPRKIYGPDYRYNVYSY